MRHHKQILDSFAIIHEVTHYMNQPEGQRNVISDMLTESISYGTNQDTPYENGVPSSCAGEERGSKVLLEACHGGLGPVRMYQTAGRV